MRHAKKLLTTGGLFLLSCGWVYSGSAIAADVANEVKISAAVAEAAAPGALAAAPIAVAAPAAAKPAEKAATQEGTNLNAATVNVGADGTVEQLNVQDLDINTALHFLSMQTKRNIIASKEVKGSVTANLYNVTFTDALNAILHPNGFDYIEKGNFIYVYTTKELEEIRKRDRKTATKVFRLRYMGAADASVLVKPIMSTSGAIALTPAAISGLPTGVSDTGGMNYATDDTLVISDFPENLVEVEKTLKELDVRPKQVLIESTILEATLQEDNALGIDFVSIGGIDFSTLTGAKVTSNVYPQVQQQTGDKSLGFGGTDFASKVPTGGLSIGFLSNNINFFLRALEEVSDTTIVANPKVLALNKHKGEVLVGDQLAYKTTTQSQTVATETVQFLDTGVKLVFRPFIGDDGYIRMEIHPESSQGAFNSDNLPQKTTVEVTSNLMIKDGRTVVIGGLFKEQTTAGRGQVPILGNVPVMGPLFRRTNDKTQRKEVVVLITPHIINDDTALYAESEKAASDVNKMMLGNRAGLQPWGRDRIAQLWLSKAQEQLEAGNREKALMYTDWALNANPRFIEAIKLREDLSKKKLTEASESSIKDYVRGVLNANPNVPDTGSSGHYAPAPAPAPTTAPAGK